MRQTATFAVIGGAAALAAAVLGLVGHHDATPVAAGPRPSAPVSPHLEHPLHLPPTPAPGVLGAPGGVPDPGGVLDPWEVAPPTAAPPAVAPHAVIRPL